MDAGVPDVGRDRNFFVAFGEPARPRVLGGKGLRRRSGPRPAALAGLLATLAAGAACRHAPPAPGPTPTAAATSTPLPVAPTPTISLPPTMGLIGTIDRAMARALTAAVPRTPTPVRESQSERAAPQASAASPSAGSRR